ncbi:MAG: nitrite/sulfite reductase, partial [Catenibacillus sp.]|nr:nitrite/sulfite reductase [Catenibacillus sp.]
TSICQVGARDSQALLSACIEAVRKENFADGVLPKIRISGCPSSCSAHQAGAIAFRGGVKQTPDGPKPAFAMYVGGCETQGREKFGKDMGIIKETDIPEMLVEIGRAIALENTDYETWIQKNEDVLETIVKKYV